jgi:hypothetical protein
MVLDIIALDAFIRQEFLVSRVEELVYEQLLLDLL